MVSVMLYPCMFYVSLSMDLFVLCIACLTVFVNCLVKQFKCASRCSFHMSCLCFWMSEVISSFKSLRTGSYVSALLMLFLRVSAYYVFG